MFLTSLSNAEIAVGYIGELASVEIVRRLGRKLTAGETENMNSCVEDLKDIAKKFEQLVENGIKELNNSALMHEVKPLIDDFRGLLIGFNCLLTYLTQMYRTTSTMTSSQKLKQTSRGCKTCSSTSIQF